MTMERRQPDVLLRALNRRICKACMPIVASRTPASMRTKSRTESIEECRQLLNQLMQEDLTWAICDKVSGKNIGAVWLRE